MSNNSFKIKKSAVLVPVATPTLTDQGELAYDSAADKLKVRGASVTDSVVTEDKVQDLNNKTIESSTIDADLNTITNIENADIKTGAAIDATKIADGSVSNTEFQYLGNVTSDVQAQLNAKAAGAASSVDNTLPRFDGTTGKVLQSSGVVVDDADAVTGITSLTVDSLNLNSATISSIANPVIVAPASGFNIALSPSGGGIVDLTGTLDVTGQADVDNLRLDGNTISSQDTNGNIVLDPNGTGIVDIQAPTTITGLANVDNLRLDDNTISSTNTNGNILLDPNGTGVVSVEGSPLRLPEIATPATPASGYGNVYFKSDGFLYQQNDDGTETKVGAGSGGINYISNPDAESTTTGWATYANTVASSRPETGTGGSPTVTWTRTTSSPLRGVGSFLFTKGVGSAQGQGVSSDITVSNADLSRVLQISFDYEIASGTYSGGTSSTDSDLIVYMYRTTATGRLIEPSIIKLDGGVAGVKYSYRGEFQTDSDATGYRLIIHVATTSASAYTVKFDNVVIGPSQQVNGAIMTPAVSYTPTLTSSGGGNITLNATAKTDPNGWWRRNGEFLEGQVSFRNGSGGAATGSAGAVRVGLPTGLVPNTAKMSTAIAGLRKDGDASLGVTTDIEATVIVDAAGYATIYYQGGTNLLQVSDLAANYIVILEFRYPVVGWGATATLGQDADTRVVGFSAVKAAGTFTHTSTGANQDLPSGFWSSVTDSHGSFSPTTAGGTYTIPVAGNYDISAQVAFTGNATGYRNVVILVNGTAVAYSTDFLGDSASIAPAPMARTYRALKAGDTVKVQAYQNSGGNLNYLGSPAAYSQFIVRRDSGPSQIAASEIVALSVSGTTSTVSGSQATVAPWTTVEVDTHGAFNATTGIWTCPAAGVYEVSAQLRYGWSSVAVGNAMLISIYKNNTTDVALQQETIENTATTLKVLNVDKTLRLVAGDTIRIQASNTATTPTLITSAAYALLSIKRIGGIG